MAEEEGVDGIKGDGEAFPSTELLTGVGMVVEGVDEVLEEIGWFSDWAYRLQGWVASRIKRSEEKTKL